MGPCRKAVIFLFVPPIPPYHRHVPPRLFPGYQVDEENVSAHRINGLIFLSFLTISVDDIQRPKGSSLISGTVRRYVSGTGIKMGGTLSPPPVLYQMVVRISVTWLESRSAASNALHQPTVPELRSGLSVRSSGLVIITRGSIMSPSMETAPNPWSAMT